MVLRRFKHDKYLHAIIIGGERAKKKKTARGGKEITAVARTTRYAVATRTLLFSLNRAPYANEDVAGKYDYLNQPLSVWYIVDTVGARRGIIRKNSGDFSRRNDDVP